MLLEGAQRGRGGGGGGGGSGGGHLMCSFSRKGTIRLDTNAESTGGLQ